MKCLEDQVASIRGAATETLKKVAKEFGPEWSRDHLVPQVLAMIKNPHYLYRMTVLQAISALSSIVSRDVLMSTMLPVIINAAKDKVRQQPWDWEQQLVADCDGCPESCCCSNVRYRAVTPQRPLSPVGSDGQLKCGILVVEHPSC